MVNHVVNFDITNFSPNFVQVFAIPEYATRLLGVSVFASQLHNYDSTCEAELVLNDDRNHICLPVQVTGPVLGGLATEDNIRFENYSGFVDTDLKITPHAAHVIILRGIGKATLTLKLETCQDVQG